MPIYLGGSEVASAPVWLHQMLADARVAPTDLRLWGNRSHPGWGTIPLAWPTAYHALPPARLNTLRWPVWGASRWAYGHFLVTTAQAGDLRDLAEGDGGDQNIPVDVQIFTNQEEQFQASLYLLPFVPLYQILPDADNSAPDAARNLYLATLVDLRYWFWHLPCPDLQIDDATTWSTFWDRINGPLSSAWDVTITLDTIEAAYLQPSSALNLPGEPIAPVIDSAAASIGHRVVFNFDGTVETQRSTTAQTKFEQDQQNYPLRQVRAGGRQFQDVL